MASSSDSDSDAITEWLDQTKCGDHAAFEKIWNRYYSNLVLLARNSVARSADRSADEEDAVQSAMKSFYFRACEGRYPDLDDREGLWKLLLSITLSKVRAASRKETRRREILEREFSGENFRKGEPSPEFAAEMADQFEELMSLLKDDLLSKIALAKLEGYYNQEIADQFGKSIPTIERKLRLIRDLWASAKAEGKRKPAGKTTKWVGGREVEP
jgi:DNA-directed RNA polymerase specialized sigma24 family protein